MISVKLTLDKRRMKKDSTYPLVFRISYNGETRDIKTGYSCKEGDWIEKSGWIKGSHHQFATLNPLLKTKAAHYLKRIAEIENSEVAFGSVQDIKEALQIEKRNHNTVEAFWEAEIALLRKANRIGNAHVYEEALVAINKVKSLNTAFERIDYNYLKGVEAEMLGQGIKVNSISLYFRTLRAVYNKAINAKVVSFAHYPFRQFKIKREKSSPRTIPLDMMKAYFNAQVPDTSYLYESWLLGKLMFLLIGINFKDVALLTKANISNGRVVYRRAKTNKVYSVRLLPETEQIINYFLAKGDETVVARLTPEELQDQNGLTLALRQKNKVFNAHLNKIGKSIGTKEKLTGYVFRYTWANIAKQLGYSKDLIAEALGHEYGNRVTGIYLEEYDLQLVDEMTERIQNALG